ncbi:MAG: FAD-dependent monooxygenase [Planctomycetota bacterium]
MENQNVLIAGAGIGGLATAIALATDGHTIDVIEQTPEPKPIGAGISLQPNAMQCLHRLGVDEQVKSKTDEVLNGQIRKSDGTVLRRLDFSHYKTRYGHAPCTITRSDLFEILHHTAIERGVQVHFDQQITNVKQQPIGVTVSTSTNDFHGDLLVGADGVHSTVRSLTFGDRKDRYSGYQCWRGLTSDSFALKNVDCMTEYWGTKSRFGCMRCSRERVYWYATLDRSDPNEQVHDWYESFMDWQPIVSQIISKTKVEKIHASPIIDCAPSRSWYEGKIVLVGDAAHPMTPNLGQGGAQAIEDAIVLALSLRTRGDLTRAFESYASHRYPRTTDITKTARLIGSIGQGSSWWKRLVRDQVIGRLPPSLMARGLHKQFDVQDHLNSFKH